VSRSPFPWCDSYETHPPRPRFPPPQFINKATLRHPPPTSSLVLFPCRFRKQQVSGVKQTPSFHFFVANLRSANLPPPPCRCLTLFDPPLPSSYTVFFFPFNLGSFAPVSNLFREHPHRCPGRFYKITEFFASSCQGWTDITTTTNPPSFFFPISGMTHLRAFSGKVAFPSFPPYWTTDCSASTHGQRMYLWPPFPPRPLRTIVRFPNPINQRMSVFP